VYLRRVFLLMTLMVQVSSAAEALTVELINDPIADGVITEDNVTGYQYVYDVSFDYGAEINFAPFGEIHLGGTVGPAGVSGSFDGTKSAWYRTSANDPSRFGVWQSWYHSSVGLSCSFGCNPDKTINSPAATGNISSNSWDPFVLDTNGDFGTPGELLPWAATNPYHSPADYDQDSSYMDPGGSIDPTTGLGWKNLSYTMIGNGWVPVLAMTVRIVHPNSPGTMNYHLTRDAWGFPYSSTVVGPTGDPVFVDTCPDGVIGDANCDGYVDIANDILTGFSNFTGPGSFGKTRAQGDVHRASGATAGDDPHDGDVDVSDILTMFGAFTGPPTDEVRLGAPAEAGDPAIPDLIYDAATGEVVLALDGAAGLIGYSLKSVGGFLAGAHTPILGGVSTSLPTELAEAALSTPGLPASIGFVFPLGMDLAALSAFLTENTVSTGLGAPLVPFDLVVVGGAAVPEPATLVMALAGLVGLGFFASVRSSETRSF